MRTVSIADALSAALEHQEKAAAIRTDPKAFFVHVRLPPSAAGELKAIQRSVLPDRAQHADIDHITLVYTKEPSNDHAHDVVQKAIEGLRAIGAKAEPIKARVQGWGYFDKVSRNGKPATALVALVDAPGLEHLHVDMARHLEDNGIEPSDNHVFTPHITLGYLDRHDRTDSPLPATHTAFTIDKVHVASRDHHEIPLGGGSVGQKAAALLMHVAGPSGSGKTTLVNRMLDKHPGLIAEDMDKFDDDATAQLFPGVRKRDYTDEMIRALGNRRQELMDAFLAQHADSPVILAGHHTEGDHVLKLPTNNLKMLDTPLRTSVWRAYRRSQNEDPAHRRLVSDFPSDYREAKDTREQLVGLGYTPTSAEDIEREIGDLIQRHSTPNKVASDATEKAASRAITRQIGNLLEKGEALAARRLAAVPGAGKASPLGTSMRALGYGTEGLADVGIHPEMGLAARKLFYSDTPEASLKAALGPLLNEHPVFAKHYGVTQTSHGTPIHWNELITGPQPSLTAEQLQHITEEAQRAVSPHGYVIGDIKNENVRWDPVMKRHRIVDYSLAKPGDPVSEGSGDSAKALAHEMFGGEKPFLAHVRKNLLGGQKAAAEADPAQLDHMRRALTSFLASRGLPPDSPHAIIAGGAMYGHGLRPKFDDVDAVVPGLEGRADEEHEGLKVDVGGDFRLGDREMTQEVINAATRHPSGLNFMSPEHVLEFKQFMNRPKDQADIEILRQYLQSRKTAALSPAAMRALIGGGMGATVGGVAGALSDDEHRARNALIGASLLGLGGAGLGALHRPSPTSYSTVVEPGLDAVYRNTRQPYSGRRGPGPSDPLRNAGRKPPKKPSSGGRSPAPPHPYGGVDPGEYDVVVTPETRTVNSDYGSIAYPPEAGGAAGGRVSGDHNTPGFSRSGWHVKDHPEFAGLPEKDARGRPIRVVPRYHIIGKDGKVIPLPTDGVSGHYLSVHPGDAVGDTDLKDQLASILADRYDHTTGEYTHGPISIDQLPRRRVRLVPNPQRADKKASLGVKAAAVAMSEKELERGRADETKEHHFPPELTEKVVTDHLSKDPGYYAKQEAKKASLGARAAMYATR